MAASVRAHANLNLFLARRTLVCRESEEFVACWGEHSELVACDLAIFRLQLAYRCHLADLCEQRQLSLKPMSAEQACRKLLDREHSIPEMQELAEREQTQGWLKELLAEDFLPESEMGGSDGAQLQDVIARSEVGAGLRQDVAQMTFVISELEALFARHRDTQQEY